MPMVDGRPAWRRAGRLPYLALLALLATLGALSVSGHQGRDLIAVLIKLALFFAAVAWISRLSDPSRAGMTSRLDGIVSTLESRLSSRRAGFAVAGMMIVYASVWSILSILRHQGLNSSGYDLGIQHQVIWSLAHGHGFTGSIEVRHYLGDHVALTMPVFGPLLWIWDDVRILLIAQSVVLALGAWPVYRLARRRGGLLGGVVWSAVYLLTPAIGFMNKYDFHQVVLALPLVLAGIDAIDERRMGRAALWLALATATREEIGVVVAAVGIWVFLARRQRLWGAAIFTIALAWSLVALYWVIPYFREGASSDTLDRYLWLGGSPGAILRTLVTEPWTLFSGHYHRVRRVLFPWQLLWPMGGLPLLAPSLLLTALPSFAISYTSSNTSQNSIYFQYNVPILAVLFWAGVEGNRRLSSAGVSREWIYAGLLLSTAGANWADPAAFKSVPPPYAIVDGVEARPNRAAFAEAVRLIPADAELLAGNYLAPHVSDRRLLYVYTPKEGVPDEEWVLLDLSDSRDFQTDHEPATGAIILVQDRGYAVRFFRDGILVLERAGEPDPAATRAFHEYLAGRGLGSSG